MLFVFIIYNTKIIHIIIKLNTICLILSHLTLFLKIQYGKSIYIKISVSTFIEYFKV